MLCKKCGAQIEETSKFCGYCGQKVENLNEVFDNSNNSFRSDDLGKTIKIEPIQEIQNQSSINENNLNLVQPINQNFQETNIQVENNLPKEPQNNKKSNKTLLIIGGGVLAIIAIVLLCFSFMKSSNNSITILKKMLANIEENAQNSATIDAKISLETTTGDTFTFSATSKVEKKNNNMDIEFILDKSILFDEINLYATLTEKEADIYLKSTLVDMMGMTSSEAPIWLYYTFALDQLTIEQQNQNISEINLEKIIDKNHFVFIEEENEIGHYQLIIDQQLIDNFKGSISETNNLDVEDAINSLEPLEKDIKIDFYITNTNKLSKIELNMTPYLEDSADISSLILSIELRDLNTTKVEIPSDAKNSTMSIDVYMNKFMFMEDEIDYNNNMSDMGFGM